MPYNQDEVVAAVTDYYQFLASLHVDPVDIKTPPPGGWPDITPQSCNKLLQTDTVISLMKHLPYITNEHNFSPILVWQMSGCNDYTFHEFQTGHTGLPSDLELEDCPMEKLRDTELRAQVVHLASKSSKYDDFISLDTSDGSMVIWDFWEPDDADFFPSAGDCFAYMKQNFIDLKMFPIHKETILKINRDDEQGQEVKRLAKEHGWPDPGKFERKKYLADMEEKCKVWGL